jgi:hypothetical protein
MPPLKYATKPFFFMVAHYPQATPAEWILPQSLKPPKKKNIGSSTNNSTITCRMQYAQTIRNAAPMVLAVGYTPKARPCLNLVY